MSWLRQRRFKIFFSFLLLSLGLLLSSVSADEKTQNGQTQNIVVIEMDGAIGPAFTDYLNRGLARARNENAQLLLIELDTPGGLLTSTRDMASLILESDVPVATYVTPSGAHAASAGTFIMYASHIAAMTDGTNVGAATPVEMGGPSSPMPDQQDKDQPEEEETKSNDKNMSQKAMEDTKAFIRGLAEIRGRNKDFAESAVTDATSLTAREALDQNVIDYLASSRSDLLDQIDGKTITLKNGNDITLNTADAPVSEYKPDWRTSLLSIITDPNIAIILMTIGVYGLILEFYNPGTMIPGTIGAICLIAGLFAMNVLPLNAAGIVLMLLGVGFMVAEMFAPSFGILGLGGLAAFLFGAAILFDTENMMGIGLDWGTLIAIGLFGLIIVGMTVWLTVNAYRKEVTTGPESLIGEKAEVVEWNGTEGRVHIQGETWQAYSENEYTLQKKDKVLVSKVDNLRLKIRIS